MGGDQDMYSGQDLFFFNTPINVTTNECDPAYFVFFESFEGYP